MIKLIVTVAFLNIIRWAIIFLTRLRFPSGVSKCYAVSYYTFHMLLHDNDEVCNMRVYIRSFVSDDISPSLFSRLCFRCNVNTMVLPLWQERETENGKLSDSKVNLPTSLIYCLDHKCATQSFSFYL